MKIMIVEDNTDAAGMLALFLQAAGHEVSVEHAPKRAFAHALVEKPEVCLLDIGLPDMDGCQLARQLRSQPETAQSVLIAITGYGQEEDRVNATAAGFDHHFVKPVESVRLLELLAMLQERRVRH
jgi:DNA-binding response OmpR family regulator